MDYYNTDLEKLFDDIPCSCLCVENNYSDASAFIWKRKFFAPIYYLTCNPWLDFVI